MVTHSLIDILRDWSKYHILCAALLSGGYLKKCAQIQKAKAFIFSHHKPSLLSAILKVYEIYSEDGKKMCPPLTADLTFQQSKYTGLDC